MLRLVTLALVLLFSTSVEARRHHYVHHVHHVHHVHYLTTPGLDLVTVQTSANKQIVVARHLATRFQSLIDDLTFDGYRLRSIHCFSLTGQVRHSLYHVGAACDFDGSLSRSPFMRYSIANRIIVKNRFRNGCTFYSSGVRDCGHVDIGFNYHRLHRRHTW
jgi:hypothetical protein